MARRKQPAGSPEALPSLSVSDHMYKARGYAEFLRKRIDSLPIFTASFNFSGLSCIQFSAPVPLASGRGAVAVPVFGVLLRGFPREIRQPAIGAHAVIVGTLAAGRAGADERLKNHSMNKSLEFLSAALKVRLQVSSCFQNRRRHSHPIDAKNGGLPSADSLPTTPHAPIIPDAIAGETWDGLVNDGGRKRILRHGESPYRFVVIEPARVMTDAGSLYFPD